MISFLNSKITTKQETLMSVKFPVPVYKLVHSTLYTANFLSGEQFLADLQDELLDVTYVEKNNDLYKFHQTIKSPCIKSLCKLMHTEIREWLSDVTGIELDDRVDTFAARYEYTDTLSCHDDELEGRRIAYILYLVPPSWTEADGGALDLYNTDEQGQPKDIVKSIVPSRNTLAFFEVSPVSFHQVAEVLTQDHVRLSVTGWFYGKPFKRPDPYTEAKLQTQPCSSIEEEVFYEWINPIYLSEDIQLEIREKFENESEIELVDFLKKEKYDEVLEVLEHAPITWIQNGPANRRRYCRCEAENLPAVLTQCIKLFQSDAMFLVLSNLTGLKLHELAKCSDSETSDDEDTDPSKSTGCSRKKEAVDMCHEVSEAICVVIEEETEVHFPHAITGSSKKLQQNREVSQLQSEGATLAESDEVSIQFKAGVLKKISNEWEKITTDKFRLM
ncbi:hypothetical protein ScPMuIL_005255 [Solemya velum]